MIWGWMRALHAGVCMGFSTKFPLAQASVRCVWGRMMEAEDTEQLVSTLLVVNGSSRPRTRTLDLIQWFALHTKMPKEGTQAQPSTGT